MDRRSLSGEGAQHGLAHAAFGKMVFHGHERSGVIRGLGESCRIDRLDAIEVDDADEYSLRLQFLIRLERFVERPVSSAACMRVAVSIGLML